MLLTEKQLREILEAIETEINIEYPNIFIRELRKWNEKQTGIQFYVNWNNAPPSASRAELTIAWHNNNKFLISENVLGLIPRPITPHPHAEIIAKYAEVAQRRADPWVEFEIFGADGEQWVASKSHLQFHDCCKYRYIGETK